MKAMWVELHYIDYPIFGRVPEMRIKVSPWLKAAWVALAILTGALITASIREARAAEFSCEQAKFWTSHFSTATLEAKAKSLGIEITAADRAKAAQCLKTTTADVPVVAKTRGGAAAARSVHTRKVEGSSPSPASNFHRHVNPDAPPVTVETHLPAEVLAPVVAAPEPEINSPPVFVTAPVVVQVPVIEPTAPPTMKRTKHMLTTEHLLVMFALLGAGTFTYLVYKRGLVPAVQAVATWWNTAKTDVTSLEARLVALERKVASFNTGPVLATAPAQAAPSPTAPTGASLAAAAPSLQPSQAA